MEEPKIPNRVGKTLIVKAYEKVRINAWANAEVQW